MRIDEIIDQSSPNMAPRMLAPDVGTIFEYHGETFRVTSWVRAMKQQEVQKLDFNRPFNMNDVIDNILASSQRKWGPRNQRLEWCMRKDAEYVCGAGVSGCVAPVEDIKIIGRVNWDEKTLASERQEALFLVGKTLD